MGAHTGRVRFARVVQASARVAATRSRLAKTQAVAQALAEAAESGAHEARLAAAYLAGSLPQRRTGVGWRSLTALPAPAAESSATLGEVDAALEQLAALSGSGSAGRRAQAVADLFGRLTVDEQRYLADLLTGQVRQGALDGVLLAAIAAAAELPEATVRRAVMLAGSPTEVAGIALTEGAAGLDAIGLAVGRPLRPMLAASAPDIDAALAQLGQAGQEGQPGPGGQTDQRGETAVGATPVALERKLDGIRLQVHKRGRDVALFTRSLDDITSRLPEVVELVAALPADALVLDAEAIALRTDGPAAGRPHPFQVTGARIASRTDPATLAATTPVTTYAFDLLHLDGDDLLDRPASERFAALAALLPENALVPRLVTDDPRAAQAFFADQVAAGHEGVVVKSLHAPYAAGRRGAGWIKVKPRHTLDLVVLAVEWGSGRRRGLLSNIHLGARDPGSATGFTMLGKTFKGMTDEMLAWQTQRFLDLEAGREGHVVHVRPEQVVEIAFDGLQRSSRYPGGLALRFARVLRYRDDKFADQADTMETVRGLAQT